METLERQEIKQIIQALLFATHEPLSTHKICTILQEKFSPSPDLVTDLIQELSSDIEGDKFSFTLEEIAGGYLFCTKPTFSPFVEKLFKEKPKEKLSQAACEVLAIIAYRQPITKPQIETLRGVDCSSLVQTLHEKGLIDTAGQLDAPGKPTLYKVSQKFLLHFGLKNLKDLPEFLL